MNDLLDKLRADYIAAFSIGDFESAKKSIQFSYAAAFEDYRLALSRKNEFLSGIRGIFNRLRKRKSMELRGEVERFRRELQSYEREEEYLQYIIHNRTTREEE